MAENPFGIPAITDPTGTAGEDTNSDARDDLPICNTEGDWNAEGHVPFGRAREERGEPSHDGERHHSNAKESNHARGAGVAEQGRNAIDAGARGGAPEAGSGQTPSHRAAERL